MEDRPTASVTKGTGEKENESEPLTSKPESTEARDKVREGTRLNKAEQSRAKTHEMLQKCSGQRWSARRWVETW